MSGFTSPIPERIPRLAIADRGGDTSETRARLAAAMFRFACLIASAWVLAYILIRSVQPYPLDAFEEYQIQKAIRWTEGVSLYGKPGTEILPEAYPPLYFWSLGLWLRCFGESFVAARLLSLVAIMGIVGCGWWGLRDSIDRRVAWLAFLTVFLSFHSLTAKFYEVSKPDTMLTMFLALAIVTGEHRSWPEALVSSAAMLLASLTKQNAPLFLVPLCLAHGLSGRWRWAFGWAAAMSALIAASYWLMNVFWHGQFFHWVFVWTAGHGVDAWGGTVRTLQAIVVRGPVLLAVVAAAVVWRPRCRWTWCLIVALGVAAMGMSKAGGRENHLLPVAFIGASVAGRWTSSVWLNRDRKVHGPFLCWSVLAALAVTTWLGLPTGRDFRWIAKRAREADGWVASVRRIEGSVAVSHHQLLAQRAGAECFFSDLILEFPGLIVPATVQQRISDQEFDYLVLEADPAHSPTPGWADVISENYLPSGELDFENRSDVLPRRLYVARRIAPYNER